MNADTIRALIVEDDLLVAEQIRLDLEDMGYLVIDIADNAKAALHMTKISKPDIVLMDIDIKGNQDGITAAEEIFTLDPTPIIFITSLIDKETFDRAKKAHPYAYLVKPANKTSLRHAIELAIENFNGNESDGNIPLNEFPFLKQNFLIKEGNKLVKIAIEHIHVIEVEEKYCSIYTDSKKYLVRISLKDILEKLSNQNFFRTHRNFVVNMDHVESIDLEANTVHTQAKDLPLGRKYRSYILKSKGYIS